MLKSEDPDERAESFWLKQKTVYIIFFVSLLALNIASALSHRLNIWDIFRGGYFHLTEHKDLYLFYPEEYYDSYLYSPSFCAMFAPFALLPYYAGYFLWNNISMLSVPYLIFKFPGITQKKKSLICYMGLLEMLSCLQRTQTNVLIGSLLLLTFLAFEKKYYWVATFAIAAGFYIKIYPIVAASLFLLYPDKKNFLLKFAVAMIVLGALPLLFIKPAELYWQYQNWKGTLLWDQLDHTCRISLTGLLQVYCNISDFTRLLVQLGGVAVFCLMYIRRALFKEYYYRVYFLAVILIWVALFNHASEKFGYSIAVLGFGLWYAHQHASRLLNIFAGVFIFITSFLTIDPTPRVISEYISHHSLKAIPYIIMWGVIQGQMLFKNKSFFASEQEKIITE